MQSHSPLLSSPLGLPCSGALLALLSVCATTEQTALAAVPAVSETTSQGELTEVAQNDAGSGATGDGKPTTYQASAPSYEERGGSKGPGFGLYGDIGAMWMIGTTQSHEWSEDCPSSPSWEPECTTRSPMGFMLEGRLGLRFGYIGLEGIGLFAGDWSKASFDVPPEGVPALASSMQVGRIGGGLGGGLRFLTAPSLLRFTLGVGGGVFFRHVYSNVSSLDGTSEGYQAPFVKVDANLVLLHFLSIGVQGLFEFAPTVRLEPNLGQIDPGAAQVDAQLGSIRVYQGPQFFFGPVVGIHFGG